MSKDKKLISKGGQQKKTMLAVQGQGFKRLEVEWEQVGGGQKICID